MNGSSKDPYIEQAAIQIATDNKWRAVAFNYGKVSVVPKSQSQSQSHHNKSAQTIFINKKETDTNINANANATQEAITSAMLQGGNNFVDVGDLNFLISYLRKKHHGFMAAIGFSMGGAKLVHFLGRTKEHSNLNAACSISSPLDYTPKNVTVVPQTFAHKFYHFGVSFFRTYYLLYAN